VELLTVLLLAVGLAMDAAAVALGAGASGKVRSRRAAARLSFHFGFFQFLMPVIGWYSASAFSVHLAAIDHWVAFGLLVLVGGRMVRAGLRSDQETNVGDPSHGWTLVVLSLATSIDALAVGLSLAMLHVNIWYPSIVIGLVTCALSAVGVLLGARLGNVVGQRLEIVGGLVLIGVGFRVLFIHLAT